MNREQILAGDWSARAALAAEINRWEDQSRKPPKSEAAKGEIP